MLHAQDIMLLTWCIMMSCNLIEYFLSALKEERGEDAEEK